MYRLLKKYKHVLTKQQYLTIKGQVKAGDIEGAKKGLKRVLERNIKNIIWKEGDDLKEVKIEKKEERKVLRYETDLMIDLAKLYKEEPELFKELARDYPVEPNTSIIYNVKVR